MPTKPPPVDVGPDVASGQRGRLRLVIRVVLGIALFALVVWYADPLRLWGKLRLASPWLFGTAVLVSIASNVMSAARWAHIARGLGLTAPTPPLVRMYGRAMTTNMLLPGATLSGDLLRSAQLAQLGNAFMPSALSVFLDRLSGLWVLCVLSMFAAGGIALAAWSGAIQPLIAPHRLNLYLLALAAISVAPFMPLPSLKLNGASWIAVLAARWDSLRTRLRQARPALASSIWQSLGVQFLSAAALWLCGLSVNVNLSYPAMLAAAAPIFIMAALPIGVAGFGTRELAAVVVLGFAGVSGDQATATALLYGVAAVIQGILAVPWFLSRT